MYCNPLKPVNLSLRMDSKDMYTALLDSFHARRAETIAGHQFAVINIGLRNGEATADLQQIHVTELAPWTGEGRPPVGTVCQYQHTHHAGEWYDGKILYISGEYTIVFGDPVNEQHYYTRNLKFRPIRTPEQIAAEAKEKAIDVIEKRIMDRMGDLNVRNLVEDLFDLLGEMSKSTDQ